MRDVQVKATDDITVDDLVIEISGHVLNLLERNGTYTKNNITIIVNFDECEEIRSNHVKPSIKK